MSQVENLLDLPLGESIAENNWENYVYELGKEYVYKETRLAEDIAPSITNYLERVILQRFWNTETHFLNAKNDYNVFKLSLKEWIPETHFYRGESKLSAKNPTSIFIQQKIKGVLLSEYDSELPAEYKMLREQVRLLCVNTFNAPADFHSGNLIISEDKKLFFFDTGTPSNWKYFLNAEKMISVLNLSEDEAKDFVSFMSGIHDKHWKNLLSAR